jgi:hypothetical protein
MFFEARVRQELLVWFNLDPGSLVHPGDSKTKGAVLDRTAGPPGDQRHLDSGTLEKLYAVSVLSVELFYFGAIVHIDDPSVGQDPIDVKDHHPDGKDPQFQLSFGGVDILGQCHRF